MTLSQLKQTIETNLAEGKAILTNIAATAPAITQFLGDLPEGLKLTTDNTTVSLSEENALQIETTYPVAWELSGVAVGKLENAVTVLTLAQTNDIIEAGLEISGNLLSTLAKESLPIEGRLAKADSWLIELAINAETLPTLADLASAARVSADLSMLGEALPTLAAVNFGFNLSSRSIETINLTGTMTWSSIVIALAGEFKPELSLSGTLADGSQITLADMLQAISLNNVAGLPNTAISELRLSAQPTSQTYDLSLDLANDWPLDLGESSLTLSAVRMQVSHAGGATSASIESSLTLGKADFFVNGNFSAVEQSVVLSAGLQPNSTINLTGLVADLLPGGITLPTELPDLAFSDVELSLTPKSGEFSLSGQSTDPWNLPIGINGLSISGVGLSISRAPSGDGKQAVSGTLAGTLNLGRTDFTATYNFPGDFVLSGQIPSFSLSPLVQALCGGQIVRSLPMPVSVLNVDFSNIAITIAPQRKSFSLAATSGLGETEMVVEPSSGGDWDFTVGFAPPSSWRFSKIDNSLAVIDDLKFTDTRLIIASSADRSLALTTIKLPDDEVSVKEGLNFFATLNMKGLGVDELLGLKSLNVYASIGRDPRNLVLEAAIEGNFQMAHNVAFGDIAFRLQPEPNEFTLTLLGVVSATIDASPLDFYGGLEIKAITTPPSFQAGLQAMMEGTWQNPMGAQGVAISDVALDLDLAFPPLRPSIGIAGGLRVGDFEGAAAVRFDTANPSQSMVAVAFNQLYLIDIFNTFCPPAIAQAIPREITTTVLKIGFEDVSIYIVPQPTNIGELYFEQGITLEGTMFFWGLRAYGYLSIDQTRGVLVKGDVDEINLAGIFKLTGAGDNAKASLYLDLRTGETPSIDITGAVELLGLRNETQLSITDQDFYFMTAGKIFNLFEATLEVRGSNMVQGDSIYIKATMKNDLFAYLRQEATKAIEAAANDAMAEIEDAQKAVTNAQNEVNKINNDIKAMRQKIQQDRDRDTKNLSNARQAVQTAQNELNSLNTKISNMRRTIQREREEDTAKLSSARRDVQNAQNEVNKIQNEINNTKAQIKRIDEQIKAKKRWLDKKKWWEKSWAAPQYAAYEVAKRSEQGVLYTKIGGLEAAKHTANGALEVAKQVVRGLEAGINALPIDADPRLVALFTARETANAALEVAKETVRGLEATINALPIDADPRIIGLFTARETANGVLEVANLTLEGVKQSVGVAADVGQFIVEFGLGGLLDIREAKFEGTLNATQGGHVSLNLRLEFMDKPQQLDLSFSFQNPLNSAKALADTLLSA